jgi:hypothetical protein
MLMRPMRRPGLVTVILLAIAIAGVPILHNHPVIPGGDHPSVSAALTLPCAVCATTNARVTVAGPRISAPVPAPEVLAPMPVTAESVPLAAALSSRAPPSA